MAERDPRDERIEQLERENAEFRAQIAELKRIVEELKSRPRKDKKQAHPFGGEKEKKNKKKAGRKPGHPGDFKPTPNYVDEEVEARLDGCPCCGGPVFNIEELLQYVIDLPEIREKIAAQGQTPVGNTPEEFAANVRTDLPKWDALIKASGVKIE